MKRFLIVLFLLGLIIFKTFTPNTASAYYTNMPASVVIGQPDFVSNAINHGGGTTPNSNTLRSPRAVVSDGRKLLIADFSNNRVLVFNSMPATNDSSADIVIGQPNMTSSSSNQGGTAGANTLSTPGALTVINGKLFIADTGNNRVLIYNSIPTSNNASADVVIGQQDMNSRLSNQTGGATVIPNGMTSPNSIVSDGTRVLISDQGNSRILIYNSIPTSNNASADVVIGQADLTHGSLNQGGSAGANTLSAPQSVILMDNKVAVTDINNNRVLIYNSVPTTNNASADVVVGQSNMTGTGSGTSTTGLSAPVGLAYDSAGGRLFVDDFSNNRILIYNHVPSSNRASADLVLGQSTFTSGSINGGGSTSATGFSAPTRINYVGNSLFVPDRDNNRLLIFNNTISTPSIGFTTPPTPIGSGRYRLTGSVTMNNNGGTYSLQTLQADLNGTGYGQISIPGGRSDGSGNSIYDFIYDFDPGVGGGDISSNLTLKLFASTFNADTNTLFYFLPFNLKSVTSNKIIFNVNKNQLSKIKDNISHFEVWSKPTSSNTWTKYIDNILPTQIDSNGDIYLTKTNSLTSISYKVLALDNWGNSQESNTLTFSNLSVAVSNTVSLVSNGIPTPLPSRIPNILESVIPTVTPTERPNFEIQSTSQSKFIPLLIGGVFIFGILVLIVKKRKVITRFFS